MKQGAGNIGFIFPCDHHEAYTKSIQFRENSGFAIWGTFRFPLSMICWSTFSEIVCPLALHRQKAQGPLIEQGRKPPELILSKFELDGVDEATFFHVLRFWPSKEAFKRGVKFYVSGGKAITLLRFCIALDKYM